MDEKENKDNRENTDVYNFMAYGDFDSDLLGEFLNVVNTVNPPIIHIYLTSNGGSHSCLFPMLHIINKNPERFKIICVEITSSAALDLIVMSDCKKEFLSSYKGGILHCSYIKLMSNELLNKDSEGFSILKQLKRMNSVTLKRYKELGVSEEKIDRVNSGSDIFLNAAEIKSLLRAKKEKGLSYKP